MSFESIQAAYGHTACLGTDMREHMPTLRLYAGLCPDGVTEFGVDDCTSTWALLAGLPKWMRSYDVVRKPPVSEVEAATAAANIDFKFTQADTTQIEIEPTDLLFIDSYHSYKQMRRELELHAAKVRKFIIMHDTVTFGEVDQDGVTPSLCQAINEFLVQSPDWKVREVFTNCHGLTVLERH